MDIQTRKIAFLQEFLNVTNDELLSKLEALLRKEKSGFSSPHTDKEIHERIQRSEEDFEAGRFKSSDELLKKYQK